jgi:predicted dehydrogenase
MSYKVAVIGAGNMGSEYIRVFRDRLDWEVVGLVSRSRESAALMAADHGGLDVLGSVRELFEVAKPDVVIVAVPVNVTLKVLRMVWEFPWACLVEKPPGRNLQEAIRLERESRKAKGQTFVALNRRFYESVTGVKEKFADDDGPRFIQLIDQHSPVEALKAGTPREVAANWQFANAIHSVDLLRFLARGRVKRVTKSLWVGSQQNFVIEANVNFSGGDRAVYTSYWNTPNTWSLSCSTPARRVLLSPLERGFLQLEGERLVQELVLEGRDVVYKPGLSLMIDELTNLMSHSEHRLVGLSEGLKSMLLVERLFRTYRIIK